MFGVLLALSALTPTADARPPHRRPAAHHARAGRPAPRVVRVGPRAAYYRPGVRLGYVWVAGAVLRGVASVGYWRPSTPPPTEEHIWVDGYWDGDVWVDGYWRIDEIDGMIWIDGEYGDEGAYEDGGWIEESTGAPARAEILPSDAVLAVPVDEMEGEEEVYPEGEEEADGDLHHAPPARW
ncbi:MAG: hypothetical protein P8R54_00365 [Myxococcota bacterium]|nr:hypothetical protein [Myxococcota bacterium]